MKTRNNELEMQSEFQKFDDAMTKILSVSHKELERREKEWKKKRKKKREARKTGR